MTAFDEKLTLREKYEIQRLFRIAHIIGARHVRPKQEMHRKYNNINVPLLELKGWFDEHVIGSCLLLTLTIVTLVVFRASLLPIQRQLLGALAVFVLSFISVYVMFLSSSKRFTLHHKHTKLIWNRCRLVRLSLGGKAFRVPFPPIKWFFYGPWLILIATAMGLFVLSSNPVEGGALLSKLFPHPLKLLTMPRWVKLVALIMLAVPIFFPVVWGGIRRTFRTWTNNAFIECVDEIRYITILCSFKKHYVVLVLSELEEIKQHYPERIALLVARPIAIILGASGVVLQVIKATGPGAQPYIELITDFFDQWVFVFDSLYVNFMFWFCISMIAMLWYANRNPFRQLDRAIHVFKKALEAMERKDKSRYADWSGVPFSRKI